MSEHEPSWLEPELEALLDAERHAPPPPEQASTRVMGRLTATLGLASAAGLGEIASTSGSPVNPSAAMGTSAGSGTGSVGGVLTWAAGGKALAGLAVLAIGAGVTWRVLSTPPSEPPPELNTIVQVTPAVMPKAAPSTSAAESTPTRVDTEPALLPPSARAVTPVEIPSAEPARPRPRQRSRPPLRGLAGERKLLERARAALADDEPEGALARLDRHQRFYPKGTLTEEREALRVRALARAGRSEDAHWQARRFRLQFPTSLFLRAVDRAVLAPPRSGLPVVAP